MPSGVQRASYLDQADINTPDPNSPKQGEEYFVLKRPHADFYKTDTGNSGSIIEPQITVAHRSANSQHKAHHHYTTFEKQTGVKVIMPFGTDRIYNKQRQSNAGFTVFVATLSVLFGLSLGIFLGFESPNQTLAFFKIDDFVEIAPKSDLTDYDSWAKASLNSTKNETFDPDNDGLSNYQEFLLKSKPLNKNSCKDQESDFEMVVNLTNPGKCQRVDFGNQDEKVKFLEVFKSSKVINAHIKKFDTNQANSLQENQIKPVNSLVKIENIEKYILESFSKKRAVKIEDFEVKPQDYLDIANQYALDVSVLITHSSATEYGLKDQILKTQTSGIPESTNNLTRLGTLNSPTYKFTSKKQSLSTFASWYQDLKANNLSECDIISILSNDPNECQITIKQQEYIKLFLIEKTKVEN